MRAPRKFHQGGNFRWRGDDLQLMRCDEYREAISARLDDELVPERWIESHTDEHLAACAACRTWSRTVTAQHRLLRVQPADPVPDLTARILASLPARSRPRAVREWARYALLTVALTQLVLALPALLLGEDAGASIHVARELGSFDVALAVGLLWAAWQPRRASGLLPMAAALAGTMALTAALDISHGAAPALGEAHHIHDLAGVAFLYLLHRPSEPATPPRTGLVVA